MNIQNKNLQNQDTLPTFKKPSQPEPISHIGKYKIETLLHKGSMSYLYLAKDPHTGSLIAIKILAPNLIEEKQLVDRFLLEAKIIAKASHKNIITVFESGTWEKGLYIAMEYVQGISLTQFIKDHAFCKKKSLEIILKVAYGILHLHSHKIIHRDIKPENILIDEKGNVKIIDFGIAELKKSKNNINFTNSPIIGTPSYMSPEQRQNPHNVQYNTDIYSLAVITYEMLIGKLSFGKIYLSNIEAPLDNILQKALYKDPAKRIADIVDFISDISSYLKNTTDIEDHSIPLIEIQNELLPKHIPKYEDLEIGIFYCKEQTTPGVYYEFFHLSDGTHLVFLANTENNNNTSFLPVINIRATIHALLNPYLHISNNPFSLPSFLSNLNQILYNDKLHKDTNTTIIHIDTFNNTISHLTSIEEGIFLLPNNKKYPHLLLNHTNPIGMSMDDSFQITSDQFLPGDICLSHSFSSNHLTSEEKISLEKTLGELLVANRFMESNSLSKKIYQTLEQKTPSSSQNFTLSLFRP